MKPIDRLGFGPTRNVVDDGEGGYILMVTPPKLLGPKPTVHVHLSADQYRRYLKWMDNGELIQNALFDLPADQREMIITGLCDEDFQNAVRSDEE